MNVGRAAAQSGWSPRMLRYVERIGLVVPARTGSGYRRYGLREVNQLRSLRGLLDRFTIELSDVAFAARLRREATLREARVDLFLVLSSFGREENELLVRFVI